MRRILLVVPLVAAALVAAQLSGASPSSSAAVVATITDGDTLTLTNGYRVRLLQIDSPEVGTGECYSRAARTALLNLAPVGSRVTLMTDPALDTVDWYGRLLRYVIRGSANVNLEMVRLGAAAPYFYRGDRGRYASQLMAAATSARATGRGLWGASPRTRLHANAQVDTGRCGPAPAPTTPPLVPLVPPPAPRGCDSNYAGACVPPYPPDLDCGELRALGLALPVRVVGSDPHRLDGDSDGFGCE
jgi:endonuclease YncB( thermonuclease family)